MYWIKTHKPVKHKTKYFTLKLYHLREKKTKDDKLSFKKISKKT